MSLARRIASAYARIYLEDFPLGNKDKIGRFYWVGLGAFAAKQVAVTLERWQLRDAKWTRLYEGLGKGNLWLFNDVLPWHYGYAASAATFNKCVATRDSRQFVDPVKRNMSNQKDYLESIDKVPYEINGETGEKKAKLGYLQHTPLIIAGLMHSAARSPPPTSPTMTASTLKTATRCISSTANAWFLRRSNTTVSWPKQ